MFCFLTLHSTVDFLCLNSVISNTNQDSFIQRALNASRTYTNIIESVREADTLAKEANTEAMEVM